MEALAGAADAPDIPANPMAIAVATANKVTRIFISLLYARDPFRAVTKLERSSRQWKNYLGGMRKSVTLRGFSGANKFTQIM
ncbi:MAG: hypothetical protein ACLPID_18995 [Beijerinckiaceae bacterium]